MPAWQVSEGSVNDLDRLKPLWLDVHHAHQLAMPAYGPYLGDDQSWTVRRAHYQTLFETRAPELLQASTGTELVGYGLAYVSPSAETWLEDTWSTGGTIGEIETLAVAPQHRGQGLGSHLMTLLHAWLDRQGVSDVILGVLPGNVDAQRLYERAGYQTVMAHMRNVRKGRPSRPSGRSDDMCTDSVASRKSGWRRRTTPLTMQS